MTFLVMKDHPNTPMSPQPKTADVKLPQSISTDETYSQRTSSSSINISPLCVASHNGGDCLSPTDMAELGGGIETIMGTQIPTTLTPHNHTINNNKNDTPHCLTSIAVGTKTIAIGSYTNYTIDITGKPKHQTDHNTNENHNHQTYAHIHPSYLPYPKKHSKRIHGEHLQMKVNHFLSPTIKYAGHDASTPTYIWNDAIYSEILRNCQYHIIHTTHPDAMLTNSIMDIYNIPLCSYYGNRHHTPSTQISRGIIVLRSKERTKLSKKRTNRKLGEDRRTRLGPISSVVPISNVKQTVCSMSSTNTCWSKRTHVMNEYRMISQNSRLINNWTQSILQLHLSQTHVTLSDNIDTHRTQYTTHWIQHNIHPDNKQMKPITHMMNSHMQTIDSGFLQFQSSSIVHQWWLHIIHYSITTELSIRNRRNIHDGCYRINILGQRTTQYTVSEVQTSTYLMKPLTSTYITILSLIWSQTTNDSKVKSIIWTAHTTTHPHIPTHRVLTSITHRDMKLHYGRYRSFFTETSTQDEQSDGRHRQQLLLKHQTNMMVAPLLQHTIDTIINSSLYTDSTTITNYGNTIRCLK